MGTDPSGSQGVYNTPPPIFSWLGYQRVRFAKIFLTDILTESLSDPLAMLEYSNNLFTFVNINITFDNSFIRFDIFSCN